MNDFLRAIGNMEHIAGISVKFSNRNELVDYTMEIIEMLKQDEMTEYIIDSETGELLFDRF